MKFGGPHPGCELHSNIMAQTVKNSPAMQETWVWSLGGEDPPEEGMATHSSILAWRILWTEEPGKLQSMGLQRVAHNWATKHTLLVSVSPITLHVSCLCLYVSWSLVSCWGVLLVLEILAEWVTDWLKSARTDFEKTALVLSPCLTLITKPPWLPSGDALPLSPFPPSHCSHAGVEPYCLHHELF